MKQTTTTSVNNAAGSEKWLLLLLLVVGIGGLLLSFSSSPKDQQLDIEGIQLESRMLAPDADEEQNDYVLR